MLVRRPSVGPLIVQNQSPFASWHGAEIDILELDSEPGPKYVKSINVFIAIAQNILEADRINRNSEAYMMVIVVEQPIFRVTDSCRECW